MSCCGSAGQMAKQPRGTTTLKGLGAPHRKQRERLLRQFVDGSLCGICAEPMWRGQALDADHSQARALYGVHGRADRLTHSACNRSEGAKLGNAIRSAGSEPVEPDDLERNRLAMQWP